MNHVNAVSGYRSLGEGSALASLGLFRAIVNGSEDVKIPNSFLIFEFEEESCAGRRRVSVCLLRFCRFVLRSPMMPSSALTKRQ